MKVLSVVGTRPEAIKMARLMILLNNDKFFYHKVCSTGQHKDMLQQVFKLFDIIPDYNLDLMRDNQSLSNLTSSILININNVFDDFKPDIVLVHGDTTTAFTTALAAFYKNIKVGHVEAGLRTFDLSSPYPEEFNRTVISKLAQYHFAPTELNKTNLLKERTPIDNIIVTGNTAIDSLIYMSNIDLPNEILSIKNILENKFILVTGHRRESFGDGFINICNALLKIANAYKDINIIYPVHYNPNVKDIVFNKLSNISNIHLIKPVGYDSFVYLMKKSYFILTDSGGVQEEAPSLNKPVLVMREKTERQEAIDAGSVWLVGTSTEKIFETTSKLITNNDIYQSMINIKNPYGDGHASKKIVEFLRTKCQYHPTT
jgi:UDP-N-acetylglucosamine 2-epimerase (non-hydrolysing)